MPNFIKTAILSLLSILYVVTHKPVHKSKTTLIYYFQRNQYYIFNKMQSILVNATCFYQLLLHPLVFHLQMQRHSYRILSLTAPYLALFTFVYFIVSQQVRFRVIEIINFSFFAFGTLLILPFLVFFIIKFKLQHEEILRIINCSFHINLRISVFVLSILVSIFSYTILFYQYYVKLREEGSMWSIEITIFLFLISYILYSKTLTLQIQSKIFSYIVYIILLFLLILFFAHLSIMTSSSIYLPELCLQILIIVVVLDCWWTRTPTFFRMIMIVADIIAFQEFLRKQVLDPQQIALLIYRIIIMVLIFIHFILKTIELTKQIRRCIYQFYEDDAKDVPLSNMMISQIPMVEFSLRKKVNIEQENGQKQVMEQSMNDILDIQNSCAICTTKIESTSLIYEIPCFHFFHSDCLEKWLQLKNSCPTCRRPAI